MAAMTDLAPGSSEWARVMTASKAAAALGVSPWESPRSLWHKMRGDVPWDDGNDATRRGHYLEEGVLAWWRDQHGVADTRFLGEWQRHPTYTLGDWAAATPDAVAYLTDHDESECEGCDGIPALVEAKTSARDDEWGDPGTDAIPVYYLTQCYWQMHVSDVRTCYVPVLFGSLRFAEYVVTYDEQIGADLERRLRAFYDSLTADEPPPLDDTVATYAALRKVHPDIDRGETVELTAAEAAEFVTATVALTAAEARARLARSVVLDRMGRAQYAEHAGQRIARRQPNGDGISLVRTAKTLAPEGAPA